MPPSAIKWYRQWLAMFPETWDSGDLERFYMFVSRLLHSAKKERPRHWLAKNLKADCSKLSDDDIEKYCDIYEHIKNYNNVWKSQQAKLIAVDTVEKSMAEARKKYVL